MFVEEARWLRDALSSIAADRLSPLLNLGSGSGHFRERVQPWIARELLAPLDARGIQVIHCDLKRQAGVDVVADILDDDGLHALHELRARAIVVSNVLEHVSARERFARRCAELVGDGGYLAITVPRSYPYHTDPIDTLYRPQPHELAALFPELRVVKSQIVTAPPDYKLRVRRNPLQPLGNLALLPYLLLRFGSLRMSRFAWLRRPFEATCCLLAR